jgi:lysophospholipase L1-like esterase
MESVLRPLAVCLALAASLLGAAPAGAVSFATLVALGDSLTRAQTNPVPHVARQLGVPLHNLAVNGATTATLLSGGQLEQAVALDPTFAFLWIGGNDIKNDPARFVRRDWDAWIANYEIALDGLLATGADVVTANMFNVARAPYFYGLIPNPTPDALEVARVLTLEWNARIAASAGARGVPVVDVFSTVEAMATGEITIAGFEFILAPARGLGMHLFNDTQHPSLVARAVIANTFIDTLNLEYDLAIPKLSEARLAEIAGVPEPGAAPLLGMGLAALALRARPRRMRRRRSG